MKSKGYITQIEDLIGGFLVDERSRPVLITILGPTGAGKSKMALEMAKKFNGEIVTADSRTVYRGMDIGTAKPTVKEQKEILHHLIDIISPDEEFTLADYKRLALKAIEEIHGRGETPFLVGGTGLYIDAVTKNFIIPPAAPNSEIRKRLQERFHREGGMRLWYELERLDPTSAKIISPNNPNHLIRALEVCLITGQSFSKMRKVDEPIFDNLIIGLKWEREKLYEQIDKRVDEMIKKGLIGEVESLLQVYPPDLPAFTSIGYQEVIQMFMGKLGLKEAIELIKKNTRNYAKRQETWFRRDERINWVEVS